MEGKLQVHAEYDSLTGMNEGLWPRFYLQMSGLAELSLEQIGLSEKLEHIRTLLMPELEQLHRSYTIMMQGIQEYESGVASGKYYQIHLGGHAHLDRTIEISVRNEVKQFIIQAKLVHIAFVNCGFVDEPDFTLETYALTKKLSQLKEQYSNSSDPRYLPLLEVLERANDLFLNDLTAIRGQFEHKSFAIPRFELVKAEQGASVRQPVVNGVILSEKVKFFYENILDFIERMMVYYIGINVERILPGMALLCVDDQFNYSQQRFKYSFSFAGTPTSETARRCLYD
jgi:hypothetical protein